MKHYGPVEEEVQKKLLGVSSATIDRVLKPIRDKLAPKGHCGTKPGRRLSHQIPIKDRSSWDITQPGFIEADTVAHCGGSLKGNFAWSLTLLDIKTT